MADPVGLGEIFEVSNKGDGSYFEGERNHDDELLFEHSLRKSWKPGTHKYSETIKAPSDKEINYIEVVDNWKDGSNGERDVTVTAKTEVRVTITGVFGRGVDWDIRVYARPLPEPTPDPPELTPDPPKPTPDPQKPYAPLCFDLGPFEEYQGRTPIFADDWTDMPRENPPVLCVVTTADREYDAVVARLEPAIGHDVVLQVVCGGVPMLVGKLGNYQVALLQTHMGAHETRGKLLQVLPNLLSVRLVMAIGFGYGLNPAPASAPTDGQMIGDVMISARCQDLSHYRATDKSIQPRGDVMSTQTKLVYVYGKAVGDAWGRKVGNWGERPRAPKIHLGTFISLPVLFNSEVQARPFVTATAHLKPIGGDMELFQIVSAVGEPGHPTKAWLGIKSICDFGGLIEKSKEGQPLAAATAAAFAHYFLSIPGQLDLLLGQETVGPKTAVPAGSMETVSGFDSRVQAAKLELAAVLTGLGEMVKGAAGSIPVVGKGIVSNVERFCDAYEATNKLVEEFDIEWVRKAGEELEAMHYLGYYIPDVSTDSLDIFLGKRLTNFVSALKDLLELVNYVLPEEDSDETTKTLLEKWSAEMKERGKVWLWKNKLEELSKRLAVARVELSDAMITYNVRGGKNDRSGDDGEATAVVLGTGLCAIVCASEELPRRDTVVQHAFALEVEALRSALRANVIFGAAANLMSVFRKPVVRSLIKLATNDENLQVVMVNSDDSRQLKERLLHFPRAVGDLKMIVWHGKVDPILVADFTKGFLRSREESLEEAWYSTPPWLRWWYWTTNSLKWDVHLAFEDGVRNMGIHVDAEHYPAEFETTGQTGYVNNILVNCGVPKKFSIRFPRKCRFAEECVKKLKETVLKAGSVRPHVSEVSFDDRVCFELHFRGEILENEDIHKTIADVCARVQRSLSRKLPHLRRVSCTVSRIRRG